MKQHPSEKHSFPFILFLAVFFAFLGVAAAFGDDDYRLPTRSLEESAAIHGTLNPRVYAAPVGQETYRLAIPLPSREPSIDYRISEPEPQRYWEPREWKQ